MTINYVCINIHEDASLSDIIYILNHCDITGHVSNKKCSEWLYDHKALLLKDVIFILNHFEIRVSLNDKRCSTWLYNHKDWVVQLN